MSRFRLAILAVVVAAAASACGGPRTPGSSQPSAASTVAPTIAPSLAPIASPAAALSAAVVAPTISLYEWKVIAGATLKSGPSTFTISNFGTIPHELLIFKSDRTPAAYPTDKAGDIIEDGAGVALVSDGENIDPAGSQTRTVDLKPGTYLFVCNIPAHFKQGMFQVVTVTK